MKCSVIIPTLNEATTIGGLVRSLVSDPYPWKEVLVVDVGSTDVTTHIAAGEGAKVVRKKGEKCPASARNLGAKVSRGKVLCFLDGDMKMVSQNFISNGVKPFEDPNVVGVAARIDSLNPSWVDKWRKSVRASYLTKFGDKKLVKKRVAWTFIKKTTFMELGGYPLLGAGEDRIFWEKLETYLKSNPHKKIVFEPSCVVYDGYPSSISEFFGQSMWYGRTVILYLKRASLSRLGKGTILGLPVGYVISILSIPLLAISTWFFILASPYLLKTLFVVYESWKNRSKYRLLTPIMDFVYGIGWSVGLLRYFLGDRRLGRG